MANKTASVHSQSMWAFILSRHRLLQMRLVLLAILLTFSALAPIHLTRLIIDKAIPEKDLQALAVYIGLLVGALLLALLLTRLQTIWTRKLEEAYSFDLRQALLEHLVHMPQSFFSRQSTGALQNKIVNEVMYFGAGIEWVLVTPFISTATAIIYTCYIFSISPALAIFSLIPMPLLFYYAGKASKRLGVQRIQCSEYLGHYSGNVSQVLDSSLEIQLHGTSEAEVARLNEKHGLMSLAAIKESTIASTVMSASQIGKDGIPIMIIGYGAALAIASGMSIGSIIAFLGALAGLLGAFDRFMSFMPVAEGVKSRYNIAHGLLAEPNLAVGAASGKDGHEPAAAASVASAPAIRLQDVSYKIDGARLLLSKVNLDIRQGEHVAVIGRSGCGKSTLLHLLTARLAPSDGCIFLQGDRLSEMPDRERVAKLGYVSQTAVLFPETLRYNLAYGFHEALAGRKPPAMAPTELAVPGDDDLISLCEEVGLGRDLLTLGLQALVGTQAGARFLELKQKLAATAMETGYVTAYDEAQYLPSRPILQNLVFAPLTPEQLNQDDFAIALYEACRGADQTLLVRLLELGRERQAAVSMLGASVSQKNPKLLAHLGLESGSGHGEIAPPAAPAADLVLSRKNRHAVLQAFREGLRGATANLTLQNKIVQIRRAMRTQLGQSLPAVFSAGAWHENMSVFDNLVGGIYDTENVTQTRALQQALEAALIEHGLDGYAKILGLDSNVGERGAKLSGGQRQKVALARVMLRKLPIVLLDEVTASLDQGSAARVNAWLRQCEGQTLVAVTHDLDSLSNFDRVIVLDQGQVIADDAPQAIMANQNMMQSVFGRY